MTEHQPLDEDHKHIWLSPRCQDERTWCQDSVGGCDECGEPEVKYIRADLCNALPSEGLVASEPVGFKLVPIEPTEAMLSAADEESIVESHLVLARVYRAMLTAAPAPQRCHGDSILRALVAGGHQP